MGQILLCNDKKIKLTIWKMREGSKGGCDNDEWKFEIIVRRQK